MRKPLLVATTIALALTGLTACGGGGSTDAASNSDCKPAHTFKTIKEGTLTVSVFDLPPYTKVENGKITGVDGGILDEIAKRECLTITATPMDAAGVIPAVQNGRADMAAGDWYRTAERAKVVTLSAPLYTDQMGIISSGGTKVISELKGKKVGTVDGYLWVKDLQTYLASDLKTYPSSTAMWQDLQAGRIEIGVDSFGSGVYTNKNMASGKYKVEVADEFDQVAASKEAAQSNFPLPKNNPDLAKAVDANIEEMKKDGTIAKILVDNGLDKSAADTGPAREIK